MTRLRATWVVEYDADPADYVDDGGEISAAEMAAMDAQTDDIQALMDAGDYASFEVEPVQP